MTSLSQIAIEGAQIASDANLIDESSHDAARQWIGRNASAIAGLPGCAGGGRRTVRGVRGRGLGRRFARENSLSRLQNLFEGLFHLSRSLAMNSVSAARLRAKLV